MIFYYCKVSLVIITRYPRNSLEFRIPLQFCVVATKLHYINGLRTQLLEDSLLSYLFVADKLTFDKFDGFHVHTTVHTIITFRTCVILPDTAIIEKTLFLPSDFHSALSALSVNDKHRIFFFIWGYFVASTKLLQLSKN